jgi:hypothetical protein
MFIPDPYFSPSRILDSGSDNNNKEDGEKNSFVTFFWSHKFHKRKMFNFSTGREQKYEPIDKEFKYFIIKYPDSGVKSTGSRIRIRIIVKN